MRKIWDSANTAPTASLMAHADARSRPIGFSSTTRDERSTSLWVARCAEIGPNKLGAQAR